jgi:hypothetical protein
MSWPPPPTVSVPHTTNDAWTVALEYGTHGGATRHQRRVLLLRGVGVLVVDRLSGSPAPSTAIRWPIPHASAAIALGESTAQLPGGHTISWIGSAPLRATLTEAGYAPGYGRLLKGARLEIAPIGAAMPAWIVTLLAAGGPTLLSAEHPNGGLDIRICDPHGTDLRLLVPAAGVDSPVPIDHHA